MNYPLQGIKVLELEGLAPTVYTGMVLSDFGAEVTIINKPDPPVFGLDTHKQYLNRGKKSIIMNLKDKQDLQNFFKIIKDHDILIDCYRPKVLENLGLGPDVLHKINPKLIICRITGYGQTGDLSNLGGHDLNYLSQSGMLSIMGKHGENPPFPGNILADFAGGGAFGVQGILLALIQRNNTGKGQVIDVSMTEGVGYLGSFIDNYKHQGIWNQKRGQNILDGGAHFYRCYETKDQKYMAVGSIESKFYKGLLIGLGFKGQEQEELLQTQFDSKQWQKTQIIFENIFKTKTRDEWNAIFHPLDCCVTPVLEVQEVKKDKNWQQRGSLVNNFTQYGAHPKLSSMPIEQNKIIKIPNRGQHTKEFLNQYGIKSKL